MEKLKLRYKINDKKGYDVKDMIKRYDMIYINLCSVNIYFCNFIFIIKFRVLRKFFNGSGQYLISIQFIQ